MKKILVFCIGSILLLTNYCYSQSSISLPVMNDVAELRTLLGDDPDFNISDRERVAELLAVYIKDYDPDMGTMDVKTIFNYFEQNPYLDKYLKDEFIAGITDQEDIEISSEIASPSMASLNSTQLPGISVIADGLASFLVERTKEELKIAFFNKLLKRIEDGDLDQVFPESTATLNNIGDEIYNYRLYLPSLRNSFTNDLNVMSSRLASLIRSNGNQKMTDVNKALAADFLDVGQLIIDQNDIHTILDSIAILSISELQKNVYLSDTISEEDKDVRDIRNTLISIGIVSNSLIVNESDESYVSSNAFIEILRDPIRSDLYLGLLSQLFVNNNVQIGGQQIAELLNTYAPGAPRQNLKGDFLRTLRNVIDQGELLNGFVEKLKDPLIEKNSEERTSLYYGIVTSLFSSSKSIVNFIGIDRQPSVYKGLNALESAVKIPIDLKRRNYSGAIINANVLLELTLKDSEKDFVKQFVRYGGFMAGIASSQNSGDINSVIEAYALPVGSYVQKRRATSMNIALNGYVGVFGGGEKLNMQDLQNSLVLSEMGYKTTFGVTAPIGVAFSWSLGENSSLSIFPSIVDLGAVVSYRFNNPDTEDLPEFALQNIIAPGVQASLGIPKTPLVFSGGWQNGPLLRRITSTDIEESVDASRWFLNLSVDIPLFSLRAGD